MKRVKALDKETNVEPQIEAKATASIKRGLKQAKQGKVISHEDVMKKHKKWL